MVSSYVYKQTNGQTRSSGLVHTFSNKISRESPEIVSCFQMDNDFEHIGIM